MANLKLGLRFPPGQARKLRDIAQQLRRADEAQPGDVELFAKAADSAEFNEPLIVLCTHPDEATLMADAFPRWGIDRPAIDQLNG